MPIDTQLVATQVETAPLVYPVADSVEFRLKAVRASFDGSGAASSFLPAVVLKSDSGHVIARAIDQSTPVSAGGSADASFFPGVKHAQASTPSTAGTLESQGRWVDLARFPAGFFGEQSGGISWVTDLTYLYGGYVNASADGQYWTFLTHLAPQGSLWQIHITYEVSGLGGKIDFDIASAAEPNPNRNSGITEGSIQETGYNYVHITGATEDTWGNVLTKNWISGNRQTFRLTGADGAPLTAFSGTDPYTGALLADGGAGWYRVRLRTNGHNINSGGFRARVQSVVIWRVDDTFDA